MPRALARAVMTAALTLSAVAVPIVSAVTAPAGASVSTYAVAHALDPYTGRSAVVRWNPCTVTSTGTHPHVISYRVNPAGASGRIALVKQAIAKLSTASGLLFRYLGTTSYVPHNDVLHYPTGNRTLFAAAQARAATHAEVVIAWATRNNMLTPAEAGVGIAGWSANQRSQLRVVEGAVVMRRGVPLKSGFADGASVGALLLHELGHAVGLQHVNTKSQIMYPTIGSWSRASYHSGDLAGLRLLGGSAGCMRTPSAAPADPVAIARAAGVTVTS